MAELNKKVIDHIFNKLRMRPSEEEYLRARLDAPYQKGGEGFFGHKAVTKEEYEEKVKPILEENHRDSIDSEELRRFDEEVTKHLEE